MTEPMSDERLAATCTDCRLRGWSERVDPKTGEMVRGPEVIDLCQRHASLERDNARLREQVAVGGLVDHLTGDHLKDFHYVNAELHKQLQAAKAVCEWFKPRRQAYVMEPELTELMTAWEATQGGDEPTTGGK